MIRRVRAASVSAVVLLAAVLSLAGCTTPPKPAPTAIVTRSPAVIYSVPGPQPGELARIIYQRPGVVTGATFSVPAGVGGYNIELGCRSSKPHHQISFELRHGSTLIVGASSGCNGVAGMDTATLPPTPAETLHLAFTGDMSGIGAAYLILTPAQ